MSRFDICLAAVSKLEGGASNHPADKGGLTMAGVKQATYDAYRRRKGLPPRPVTQSTQVERVEIYRAEFWTPVRGDAMPAPIDLLIFDMAVNSGPDRAIKTLQRALGVTADGVFGAQTLRALQEDTAAGQVGALVRQILDRREDFYRARVAKDASQQVFLAGWLNRLDALESMA